MSPTTTRWYQHNVILIHEVFVRGAVTWPDVGAVEWGEQENKRENLPSEIVRAPGKVPQDHANAG